MSSTLKFEEMKISELNEYCTEKGIKGVGRLKKAEIIDKIKKLNTTPIKKTITLKNKTSDTASINNNTILNSINNKFNVLDLFCGCGGMTEGLKETLNVVCGIDIWDKAIDSYKKNHTHLSFCKDLTKFPPRELEKIINTKIDIIVGGPPCQGFSMAGKRDKNDPRNSLFMEFYNYITYFNPKAFIMENVMGILSMKIKNNEKAIDIIMNKLTENYNCCINKLYASDFGVPQNRRRVIIIGIRKDLDIIPTEIELIIKDQTMRIPVSQVLENKNVIDKKYYLSEKAIDGIKKKKERMIQKKNGFGAQFLDLNKPSYTIPARYWKDGYDALVKYSDKEIRRLTIKELKRIQSFPDNYKLIGNNKEQIMQIGNAVACKLAYHLGNYINNILR
jgi:DNA (cytosine-5)-methyltransferase 1